MNESAKDKIIKTLKEKAVTKQIVYDNTLEAFNLIKKTLKQLVKEYNSELQNVDDRILLEYKDRGAFEAEIKIAGDLLIFNMHSNVFDFDVEHNVWKISYVKDNNYTSFAGIINIYNFLSDSFKYNRLDDLGYLIGRIFINKDKHYFVEGKRQLGFLYNDFGNSEINSEAIKNIVESAILYSLDFDLLVPKYDNVMLATVAQMKERINKSKIVTGKRLGFRFYKDDDEVK
jgi:hypothetical protein